MAADLPEPIAPQTGLEFVVAELIHRQRWFMEMLMEDQNIRETYYKELARIPADPDRSKF